MNHTVIDVLIYIFQHFAEDESDILDDEERLRGQLRDAGFESTVVRSALDWLNDLSCQDAVPEGAAGLGAQAMRCYTPEEQVRLDADCRGFLLFLEMNGVLDFASREMVIERVMALDAKHLDVEQLKWIVLMVLFNLPGYENAYFSMEDLVDEDVYGVLH